MRRGRGWMNESFQFAVAEPPLTSLKIVDVRRAPGAVAVTRRFCAAGVAFLSEWRRRIRSRRELSKFTDLQLSDLAVTRDARDFEVRKPFWSA